MKTKEELTNTFNQAQIKFDSALKSGNKKEITKAAGVLALARKELDSFLHNERMTRSHNDFVERMKDYKATIAMCRALGLE